MESTTHIIPPFSIEIDGVLVDVLEIIKHQLISGDVTYSVAVKINYKGIKSKTIHLTVKNETDLKNKLKIEVTKIKFMEMTYGLNYVKSVIT